MSAIVVNNQYITDFETDLSYKAVNAWNRTLKRLWWPRVMLLEPPSASYKRIVEWQLETARIHHLGPTGKDHVYDPILTASQEILYDHFGNALKLDKSQMSDNRFDKAPKWASEEDLNKRIPLSIAQWHAHVNICLPPKKDMQTADWKKFGPKGSILTKAECDQAGGRFMPQLFGWMVHVYPFEETPEKIWTH